MIGIQESLLNKCESKPEHCRFLLNMERNRRCIFNSIPKIFTSTLFNFLRCSLISAVLFITYKRLFSSSVPFSSVFYRDTISFISQDRTRSVLRKFRVLHLAFTFSCPSCPCLEQAAFSGPTATDICFTCRGRGMSGRACDRTGGWCPPW